MGYTVDTRNVEIHQRKPKYVVENVELVGETMQLKPRGDDFIHSWDVNHVIV